MDPAKLEEAVKRRENSRRRARILRIIELIEAGEIDSEQIPKELLYYRGERPREVYISPKDRDSYNYGYMELDEMRASSPYA